MEGMRDEDLTDHDLLIRIDGKLDGALVCLSDHETRIRKVEGNFVKVLSVGAIVGFITGWIGGLLK
jgi:hypothetical protein